MMIVPTLKVGLKGDNPSMFMTITFEDKADAETAINGILNAPSEARWIDINAFDANGVRCRFVIDLVSIAYALMFEQED